MRFRTWIVAALGLSGLLLLIVVSMVASSRKAQEIYAQLDQLNVHHQNVDATLRRLRSDVNLSGIFLRDYLLDVAREHAPEYRENLAKFRESNKTTVAELLVLDEPQAERIRSLGTQLDEYWQTFEPVFDWTIGEKVFRSASFLRKEVVPRRESILAIAQEIEELNNANVASQRDEVARRYESFRAELQRLFWQAMLLGITVAVVVVVRLRVLERRSEHAEAQMRELSQQVVNTQEEERKILSRELHDHVAQVLTGLRMELGRVERMSPAVAPVVAECKTLVDDMFRTVRNLALGLRPSMLDDFGLQAALEWHARDSMSRFAIDVDLQTDGRFEALPDKHRTCVYRVVQEATTNCVRHADARKIQIRVHADQTQLHVRVSDDGRGLDPDQPRRGFGLRGIDERVRELHGTMTISSAPSGGTTVLVTLPLPAGVSMSEMDVPLARAAG